MSKELYELVNEVHDEKTFLLFVDALLKDRIAEVKAANEIDYCGRGSQGWENHSIEDFLEAAQAWGEDTNMGESQNLANVSPWQKCATFLYCGKIYE